MPFTQRLFERRKQCFRGRVDAVIKVFGEEVFVLFDDLVDKRTMCCGDRFEVTFTIVVTQDFNDILTVM